MRKTQNVFRLAILLTIGWVMCACRSNEENPAAAFYAEQESLPPEKRVPEWDRVKALMSRPAPAVGDVAPDFTLPTLDGDSQITRSAHQEDKPLLMIFGSYT